jgi:hypothetical protein
MDLLPFFKGVNSKVMEKRIQKKDKISKFVEKTEWITN